MPPLPQLDRDALANISPFKPLPAGLAEAQATPATPGADARAFQALLGGTPSDGRSLPATSAEPHRDTYFSLAMGDECASPHTHTPPTHTHTPTHPPASCVRRPSAIAIAAPLPLLTAS